MSDNEDEVLTESGPATSEERAAIVRIFREAGLPELDDDAQLLVGRAWTAEDLRGAAEEAAVRFERGEDPNRDT